MSLQCKKQEYCVGNMMRYNGLSRDAYVWSAQAGEAPGLSIIVLTVGCGGINISPGHGMAVLPATAF